MPIPLINKSTGEIYAAADEAAAEQQMRAYGGLSRATPDEVAHFEQQKRSGSLGDQLINIPATALATGAEAISGLDKFLAAGRRSVTPDKIAPSAYTPKALDRRTANPTSSIIGAAIPDVAAGFAIPGGGGALGLALRAGVSGLLSEAGETAVTFDDFSMADAGLYGVTAGVLEGVGSFAWNAAMRALGKRKSAVDKAVGAARQQAVQSTLAEREPARRAAGLVQNEEAIYEHHQTAFDQAMTVLDERAADSPERLFTPGMLRRTVRENEQQQAEHFLQIASRVDQAAQVSEVAPLQEAARTLYDALGGTGPEMFTALRAARKSLTESMDRLWSDTPLTREALESLDQSLRDEAIWGRAAKHHGQFADPSMPVATPFRVQELASDPSARAALEARLDAARSIATATNDKALKSAIASVEQAVAGADDVTGAKLGVELFDKPDQSGPSLVRKLIDKGAAKIAGKVVATGTGMLVGGAGGGLAGNIAADIAEPYIEKLAKKHTDKLGKAAAHALGWKWLKRVFRGAAKGAAKRAKENPLGTLGAGLGLGGTAYESATSDPNAPQQDGAPLAASAGLLLFFLSFGGRRQLAEELGEHLVRLSARERMHVRLAAQRSSARAEELLRGFARGERRFALPEVGHGSHHAVVAQDVMDAQHTIQTREYERLAGLEEGAELPPDVDNALQWELRARNLALVENDRQLYRLAQRGHLEALPTPAPEPDAPASSASLWDAFRSPQIDTLRVHADDVKDAVSPGAPPERIAQVVDGNLEVFARAFRRDAGLELSDVQRQLARAELERAARSVIVDSAETARERLRPIEGGRARANAVAALTETPARDAETLRQAFHEGDWSDFMDQQLAASRDTIDQQINHAYIPAAVEALLMRAYTRFQNRISGYTSRAANVRELEYVEQALREHMDRRTAQIARHNPDSPIAQAPRLATASPAGAATAAPSAPSATAQLPPQAKNLLEEYERALGHIGGEARYRGSPEYVHTMAQNYLESWETEMQTQLGRQLTDAEREYGRHTLIDGTRRRYPAGAPEPEVDRTLSVIQGEGQGVQGNPQLRRFGLPEPTAAPRIREQEYRLRVEGHHTPNVSEEELLELRRADVQRAADVLDESGESITPWTDRQIDSLLRGLGPNDWLGATDEQIYKQGASELFLQWKQAYDADHLTPAGRALTDYAHARLLEGVTELAHRETRRAARELATTRAQNYVDLRDRNINRRLREWQGSPLRQQEFALRNPAREPAEPAIVHGLERSMAARLDGALDEELSDYARRWDRGRPEVAVLETRDRWATVRERAHAFARENPSVTPEEAERFARARFDEQTEAFDLDADQELENAADRLAERGETDDAGIDEVIGEAAEYWHQSNDPLTPAQERVLRARYGEVGEDLEIRMRDYLAPERRDELESWAREAARDLGRQDESISLTRLRRTIQDNNARLSDAEWEHVESHYNNTNELEGEWDEARRMQEEEDEAERADYDNDEESPDSDWDDRPINGLPDRASLREAGLGEIHGHGTSVFDSDLTLEDCRQLFALDEIQAYAAEAGERVTTKLELSDNQVQFSADGEGLDLTVTFSRKNGGVRMYADRLFLPETKQGAGLAKKFIRSVFQGFERLGGTEAACSAVAVGKYNWLALGFRPGEAASQECIDTFTQAMRSLLSADDIAQLGGFERLKGSIETTRDVADAVIPLEMGMRNMEKIKSELGRGHDLPRGAMDRLVHGDKFKIGKAFLLAISGEWNSNLKLKLDRDDPWFREFLKRVGLVSALGVGAYEFLQSLRETPIDVSFGETEPMAPTASQQPQIDADARDLERQATRQKLSYLSTQRKATTAATSRALVQRPDPDVYRPVARKQGITASAGVAQFVGDADSVRASYDQKRAMLDKLESEPLALVDEMAEGLAELADHAPELHAQMVGKTYEIVRFLKEKSPGVIGASMTRPEGVPPNELALRQFALYYSAATNPSTVYADLANNRARREQVQTLQAVWPEMYAELRTQVMVDLADAKPTLAQRARLDLLFDLGEGFERAFSPRIVAALNEARQPQGPEGPGGGPGGPPGGGPGKAAPKRRTNPSIVASGPLEALARGGGGAQTARFA